MARIRSVHPGLLTDEAFMTLTVESPLAIPLLVGLWMEADDAGTFEWKPLTLKARILPAITQNISELLDVLSKLNFIRSFEIEGKSLGVIRNFVKFQRPKSPKEVFAFTLESRRFAGFTDLGKRPNAGTGRPPSDDGSESVPNSVETTSEIEPQREEEGGRREEVGGGSLRERVTRAAQSAPLPKIETSEGEAPEPAEQFGQFWEAWPHKVAKAKAAKAFDLAAREPGFALPELLSGVARYVRDKPPDRQWLNPSTFLAERRWLDQPAPISPGGPPDNRRSNQSGRPRTVCDVGREHLEKLERGEPTFSYFDTGGSNALL